MPLTSLKYRARSKSSRGKTKTPQSLDSAGFRHHHWRRRRNAKPTGKPLPEGLRKNTFPLPILLPIFKKPRFSAVRDGPIPDFNLPKDGSNPDSGQRLRIDDGQVAPSEILHLTGGPRRPSGSRGSSDHCVQLPDRPAIVSARHRNPGVLVRRITVEAQEPPTKILGENSIDRRRQDAVPGAVRLRICTANSIGGATGSAVPCAVPEVAIRST